MPTKSSCKNLTFKTKRLLQSLLLILGIGFAMVDKIVCAEPLLAINQTLWNEKTTIVIANCSKCLSSACPKVASSLAKIHYLKSPSMDKSFVFLDVVVVSEKNAQYVYALSSEQDETISVLYRVSIGNSDVTADSPEITAVYKLPFGAASGKLSLNQNLSPNLNRNLNPTLNLNQNHVDICKETQHKHKTDSSQYLLLTANESEKSLATRKTKILNQSKQSLTRNTLPVSATILEDLSLQSYATLFELSDKKDAIKPITNFTQGIQGNMKEITNATLVLLPNHGRAVILGGKVTMENTAEGAVRTKDIVETAGTVKNALKNTPEKLSFGAIRFIFLDSLKSPVMLMTNAKQSISTLMALDQTQKNYADTLYAWDQGGGMWKVDLKNISAASMQKVVADQPCFTTMGKGLGMKAVKSMEQPGVAFYIAGQLPDQKNNFFRLEIPLAGKPQLKLVPADITSNSALGALFLRFGRLILIPKLYTANTLSQAITVVEITPKGEKLIAVRWENGFSLSGNVFSLSKNLSATQSLSVSENLSAPSSSLCSSTCSPLSQAYLLWDEKQQQDVLVSLNQNCDLNILAGAVSKDKYRRMSWQKIRN